MNELLVATPADDPARPLGATMLLDAPGSAFDLLDPAERSALLDRAYDEFCNLEEAGQPVDPDEYCDRFPAFRTSLARLLGAHLRLENSEVLAEIPVRWPEPGEEFLGYGLTRVLGQGAFARVYLARERAVGDRHVVVKLSAGAGREAHTLGQFRHPNVVPILSAQYDVASKLSVVCMPFLGGTTLQDILDVFHAFGRNPRDGRELLGAAADKHWPAENAAPPPAALSRGSHTDAVVHVIERLADALRAVHKNGLLHRDLKPSNVLLTPNGVPVLIDFNLAASPDAAERRMGGTLPYMPPEQLRAMGGLAELPPGDVRGDLYALGVIAYELLTGVHPFGPVPVKLSHFGARDFLLPRIEAGPRPLRARNRAIDPRLEAIVLRCIAADPAQRPASADELLADIRRYRSPARRAARWVRAHLRLVTAAAVMAVMSAGVGLNAYARMAPLPVRMSQTGDDHYRAGNFPEAVAAYARALAADPNRPDLHYKRGRAYQMAGDFGQAIEDFKRANPETNAKAAACIGACQARMNWPETAVEWFDAAIRKGLTEAELFAAKAFCLRKIRGKFGEARDCASQALAADPTLVAARVTRATAGYQLACMDQPVDLASVLDDFQAIFSTGRGTAGHYHLAACTCAKLIDQGVGNLEALGKEYVKKAAECGRRLETCPLTGRWVDDQVVVGPPGQEVPGDDGYVDPLAGRLE